jgi:hypothetical protein
LQKYFFVQFGRTFLKIGTVVGPGNSVSKIEKSIKALTSRERAKSGGYGSALGILFHIISNKIFKFFVLDEQFS